MKNVQTIVATVTLTLMISSAAFAGTITGSRTSSVGTITGSRVGTITGSSAETITDSTMGTITGSRSDSVDASDDLMSDLLMLVLDVAL